MDGGGGGGVRTVTSVLLSGIATASASASIQIACRTAAGAWRAATAAAIAARATTVAWRAAFTTNASTRPSLAVIALPLLHRRRQALQRLRGELARVHEALHQLLRRSSE